MKVGKDLVAVAEFILLPAGRDLAKGRNEFEIGARLCSSLESTENLSGTCKPCSQPQPRHIRIGVAPRFFNDKLRLKQF